MTRFRRTKEEIEAGLTPEQAKAKREAAVLAWTPEEKAKLLSIVMPPMTAEDAQKAYDEAEPVPLSKKEVEKIVRKVTQKGSGEIIVRIRPAKGVDADYFEHLRDRVIEVTQDEHWYKWFDHLVSKVYNEHGQEKLFEDILSDGIGQVLSTKQFTKDI